MPLANLQARKEYAAKYYNEHREQKLTSARKHYERNYEITRQWNRQNRVDALTHYGDRKCACCGNGTYEFLCIDHVNGGGGQHRKEVGGGARFYYWLKKNGYPDGYQVLCHNCNLAKGFYGECPHQHLMREVGGLS